MGIHKRRWIAICVGSVAALLGAAALSRPTLDEWVAKIARPGYRLLLKREAHGYYIAVFDAGGSQLAICKKDVGGGHANPARSYVVYDLKGNDLISFDLPERNRELKRETYVPPFFHYVHSPYGVMYPVDPAHVGPVRVVIVGERGNILDEVLPSPRLDPPPAH